MYEKYGGQEQASRLFGGVLHNRTEDFAADKINSYQPKDVTAPKGKTAKVTVKASGDELTYQWFFKNAGSSKYTESSVTSATYSTKMTDKVDGRQVYCVVTDKYGKTVKSDVITLKMK